MLHRRHFLAGSAGLAATLAVTGRADAEFRRLPVELVSEIDGLKGTVVLGSATPDVTLYEFFDYNCGYCRQSAADVPELLKADPDLRYVLVNFAVLSEQSILAHRVALAFLQLKPKHYLAFHQQLFQKPGRKGAEEAIDVALALGANEKALVARSNAEETTQAMLAAAKLGDNLGLVATPSYIAGADGKIGFLPLEEKRAVIASLRRCERMTCG
jgi:protein-disulfide isomerase